jgi:hypothetical protein
MVSVTTIDNGGITTCNIWRSPGVLTKVDNSFCRFSLESPTSTAFIMICNVSSAFPKDAASFTESNTAAVISPIPFKASLWLIFEKTKVDKSATAEIRVFRACMTDRCLLDVKGLSSSLFNRALLDVKGLSSSLFNRAGAKLGEKAKTVGPSNNNNDTEICISTKTRIWNQQRRRTKSAAAYRDRGRSGVEPGPALPIRQLWVGSAEDRHGPGQT